MEKGGRVERGDEEEERRRRRCLQGHFGKNEKVIFLFFSIPRMSTPVSTRH